MTEPTEFRPALAEPSPLPGARVPRQPSRVALSLALGMALSLGLLSTTQAQVPVAIDTPPTPDAALRMVYGGPTWRDERVAAFFGGRSPTLRAEVREVFRARYLEGEVDKLMLVYQLTPGPRDQFRCDACVPALGAAVLAADEAGHWKMRARGLLLMPGMPGSGDEDLQLLQIADERWTLRSRRYDNDRGRESRSERLVIERQGEVQLAADLGFSDKLGPLACGARAAPQSTGVSVLSPGVGPRVEVVLRFNEGDCASIQPVVQRTRLELREGRFQLVPDPAEKPDPEDDRPSAAPAPAPAR